MFTCETIIINKCQLLCHQQVHQLFLSSTKSAIKMCKAVLTDAQRFYNIDFKCCPYSKEQIIRDRRAYTQRTGKSSFYYHCCKCKRSKRLANLDTIDDTYMNLWCENCLKDKSDDEYVIVKNEGTISKSTNSESSFSEENDNLKSFGLDDESIRKFCLEYFSINNSHYFKDLQRQLIDNKQKFDKSIKDRDSKIQNLKDEIANLEGDINYYRNESNRSWKKCNTLLKELEIVKNNEKRILEELNDTRPRKRRHSIN